MKKTSLFLRITRSIPLRFLVIVLFLFFAFSAISFCHALPLLPAALQPSGDRLLLDPGHGGIDGGAVSLSGTCEKDINLAISLAIKELAEQDGWQVYLTRDTDRGLYTGVKNDGTDNAEIKNGRSIRSLKTEDLQKRAALLRSLHPAIAVSIHLNSFREDRTVRGAQTFFPSTPSDPAVAEESENLAKQIQTALTAGISDGTSRTAMKKDDVLLLKDPPVPTVLVECGFLSNVEEASLLNTISYQDKLARCIYQGLLTYSGKGARTPIQSIDSRSATAPET